MILVRKSCGVGCSFNAVRKLIHLKWIIWKGDCWNFWIFNLLHYEVRFEIFQPAELWKARKTYKHDKMSMTKVAQCICKVPNEEYMLAYFHKSFSESNLLSRPKTSFLSLWDSRLKLKFLKQYERLLDIRSSKTLEISTVFYVAVL